MTCPHCHARISERAILSEAGRISAGRRKRSGPHKLLRPCPHCGQDFGAREIRAHKPHCDQRKQG